MANITGAVIVARNKMTIVCLTCGADHQTWQSATKYCSDACRYKARPRSLTLATCETCGVQFFKQRGVTAVNRFCGRACVRASRQRDQCSPIDFLQCRHCARWMVRRGNQRYCSDDCRRVHGIDRIMGMYYAATNTGRVKVAMKWRWAMVAYLAERDGSKCGICDKRIDLELASGPRGSDKGPTIDHVIPQSKGGSHDLSNLRLAHWSCNRQRGNRGEAEQLRLVG